MFELSSHQLQSHTKLGYCRNAILFGIWKESNLPLHQLLEPMQHFLGDPDSRMLNLEAHRLALAIAKKTLDENRFKTAQKTMDQTPPSFEMGDRVYFKNKQPKNGT